MATLHARQYILQNAPDGAHEFFPGDVIPNPDQNPDAAGWVESGAAYWLEGEPAECAKAVLRAAEPGMPGLAVGGEGVPDNLVGKVPKTAQRRRRK